VALAVLAIVSGTHKGYRRWNAASTAADKLCP
jgi:hypothetical protein